MDLAISDEPLAVRPSELRSYPRVSIDVDVSMESEHNFFTGIATNLSEGGLFVATHHLYEIGTLVSLTFSVPGLPPISGMASVRWLRLYNEASDSPPGMGLEFVWLEEPSLAAIRAFVAERPPILWE